MTALARVEARNIKRAKARLRRYLPGTQNVLHLMQEARECVRTLKSTPPDAWPELAKRGVTPASVQDEAIQNLTQAIEIMAFLRPDIEVLSEDEDG